VCVLWIKFYSQVKEAYINFLNHCYIDTEVEMKEIYTSNHMWSLFEKSFLVDMGHVANATHDRKHADTALENYIINSVMNIISTFFNSPFSDQSTTVQVGLLPFVVDQMWVTRDWESTRSIFEMIVGVLTAFHTQYTWDRSICIFFLFNRTTLPIFCYIPYSCSICAPFVILQTSTW